VTENPIVGSRVTLAASRAGPCLLFPCSSSIALALRSCMVENAVLRLAAALQVSGVSGKTLPHEYSDPIVPGSIRV
jgi:hypothetical protein